MSNIAVSRQWRAGFEVEVVLGDLDEVRFSLDRIFEPMDVASHSYCRAVAKRLTEMTGERWVAPRGARPGRTGYFVVPEYDIDPLHFPGDLIAGVELITPPLPLEAAEDLRQRMREAITQLGGYFNFGKNPITDGLGWHINLDTGSDRDLDPALFALGADERAMLRLSGRGGTKYTGTQRHAFGVPLLRELAKPHRNEGLSEELCGFLYGCVGNGKSYAANFARDHYVELRHYGVRDFLGAASLQDLVSPAVVPMQMHLSVAGRAGRRMVTIFECLREFLDALAPRLDLLVARERGLFVGSWQDGFLFDGEPAGGIFWHGSAEIWLDGPDPWSKAAAIHRVLACDWKEAVALLALDVVEDRRAGRKVRLANAALSDAIDELRRTLGRKRLLAPIDMTSDDGCLDGKFDPGGAGTTRERE